MKKQYFFTSNEICPKCQGNVVFVYSDRNRWVNGTPTGKPDIQGCADCGKLKLRDDMREAGMEAEADSMFLVYSKMPPVGSI